MSQDELAFLSGESDLERAARRLWGPEQKLLVVTLGKQGCVVFTANGHRQVPGFSVKPVDTTGAGDGFVAGLLQGLYTHSLPWQDLDALEAICRYANAVGALTTTQRGAIPALPTAAQVAVFMNTAGA